MSGQSSTEFGRKIRQCRRKMGWTQTYAAKIMGVQRTSLNRWEQGHEMPRGESMTKLVDHMGVPIGANEEGRTYQLLLPFDQPINFEVRVGPKTSDTVQFQVQLKDLAS